MQSGQLGELFLGDFLLQSHLSHSLPKQDQHIVQRSLAILANGVNKGSETLNPLLIGDGFTSTFFKER